MESIWQQSKTENFNKQTEDIYTDILIIGGGITGILTAFLLNKAGVNYCLIEKDKILNGVTLNTTAKITAQHGFIYNKILKTYGVKGASNYLKANQKAIENYKELAKNIDCDFNYSDNYVYSFNEQNLKNEINALKQIGAEFSVVKNTELPFKTAGAIKFKNQAEFNPIKFLTEISKGLNIYEDTKALENKGNYILTSGGKIYAKKIIVATHFPIFNKHGGYFIKMYQHRSYCIALKNAPKINGMYVDENDLGLSFRNYKDLLIVGGGSHRTGEKGGGYNELIAFKNKTYKNAEIVSQWATQDCITLDGIAYIGKYSKNTENLYTATGFNKWGMTTALVAADILKDMALNKTNELTELFNPSRSVLHPQLFINGFKTSASLLRPTTPRCMHLGCALKWNKDEHTWDCSCHGSRFSKTGKVLNGPATDDIKL